jgi:ribosomal protein S8
LRQGILGQVIWGKNKGVVENLKALIENGRKIYDFVSDIKLTGFSIGIGIVSLNFDFPEFPA